VEDELADAKHHAQIYEGDKISVGTVIVLLHLAKELKTFINCERGPARLEREFKRLADVDEAKCTLLHIGYY